MENERAKVSRPWLRTAGWLLLGLTAGLGAGLGAARLMAPGHAHPQAQAQPSAPKAMYQCPMHPQIIQDHPGDCPICGMALVPMEGSPAPVENAAIEGHAPVLIDAQRQQLIGLRTEAVQEGEVGGSLHASGRVAVDETRVRRINVKVEGFVERLFADFTGKEVRKGAPLFSLYSPEFVSAQREYLLALKTREALKGGALQASGGDLLEAARRRLTLWDVGADTLEHLEKTGDVQRSLILRSPISGVVTAKNIVEGARLTPGDAPFEITDLSRIWVLADVYESEVGRVRAGLPAEFRLPAFPGHVFRGRVAFVDPVLDPKSRTLKVRLEFPNPRGELKPEMFGEVTLQAPSRRGLTVPLDAVLDSGSSKVVFVALGDGRFEPREVITGEPAAERIEIRSGLSAGEEVVVRAAFLVDSESRLKAALAQLGKGREQ